MFPTEPAGDLLASLLASVLENLDPKPEFCIEAAAKVSASELELWLELKTATDNFVSGLAEVLEGSGESKLLEVGLAVYRPFRGAVERYGEMEGKWLQGELASWSTSGKDTIDEIHSLGSCVSRLGAAVEGASRRCRGLTVGCGYPGLAGAVARGLDTHLDRYRRIMRRLEKRKVVVDDDWSVLQHCLSANQATGDLLLQMEQLDVSLCLSFLDTTRPFLGAESCSSLQQHHRLLCPEQQQKQLLQLYTAVAARQGDATPLLQESVKLLSAACGDLQKTTFSIMFHPVSSQLELVPGLEVWAAQTAGQVDTSAPAPPATPATPQGTLDTSSLPDFSFSPCEYITCVGEYLMTLPQHLEPYMSQVTLPGPNPAQSIQSVSESIPVPTWSQIYPYLKNTLLPHTSQSQFWS